MFSDMAVMLPHVKSGRVRALAVTGPKPTPLVPGMPAVAETVPGFVMESWWGLLAPAGTPDAIITRLNTELARILQLGDVKDRFASLGIEARSSSAAAFSALIKSELVRYAKLIKDIGITLEFAARVSLDKWFSQENAMSGRKKILVVDDDDAVIDLLHVKLGKTYDVVSTNAPDRVLLLARQESPDLIICDIGMPELDGADVSSALRNDRELHDIPFVFLTALASPSDMQGLGELGGRPAISKLCSTRELLAGVQKMLDA